MQKFCQFLGNAPIWEDGHTHGTHPNSTWSECTCAVCRRRAPSTPLPPPPPPPPLFHVLPLSSVVQTSANSCNSLVHHDRIAQIGKGWEQIGALAAAAHPAVCSLPNENLAIHKIMQIIRKGGTVNAAIGKWELPTPLEEQVADYGEVIDQDQGQKAGQDDWLPVARYRLIFLVHYCIIFFTVYFDIYHLENCFANNNPL